MKKRICSIFLALALLSAHPLAQAAPGGEGQTADLEITGEVAAPPEAAVMLAEVPLISVRVPASSWVIANPYGMEITRDGVTSSEEIVSPVLILENQSEVPIRVDAQAVGTTPAGSEAVFVQEPPAQAAADKELFLYAEFQPLSYRDAAASWLGAFYDASNQLLITASGLSKNGLMDLEAAGSSYSLGAMQVFGSLSADPDQPWQEADGFSVKFAFTFTAAAEFLPTSDQLSDAGTGAAPGLSSDTDFEEDASLADEPLPDTDLPEF